MMRRRIQAFFEKLWYSSGTENFFSALSLMVLSLFSKGYVFIVLCRKKLYQKGLKRRIALPVPLVVVGNMTVGGTGKTPLVIALAQLLKEAGYRPGIVSRGYGGKAPVYPFRVTSQSNPLEAGDEAVIMALHAESPVAVDPDRPRAAACLLEQDNVDVLLSDDGLQHERIARDMEIVVIDGKRRFGNERCLPAGPLREPLTRLKEADFIVVNGDPASGEIAMRLIPQYFEHVKTGIRQGLNFFEGQTIWAVAGIGHPERFFKTLEDLHIQMNKVVFPDHHIYSEKDLQFFPNAPIVMTEKDAVKCKRLYSQFSAKSRIPENLYYLSVDAELPSSFTELFFNKLNCILENKRRAK